MKKTSIIIAIVLGGGVLLCGIVAIWAVGLYNNAAGLRTQYDSKAKANEAIFDNTWKKISQTAQVTDSQKNALKEIFNGYAQARTGNGDGGQLVKWVKEAIPNVDTTVYRNLQNIITGARDEWTANQVALVDIANSYNLLLARFPSNVILGALGFQRINAKIITSGRTDRAFESGKDDDVSLTGK